MVTTAELLSTSTAARTAGVSAESIRSWIRAGILPAQSTAIGALIDRHELDRVLQARDQSRAARVLTRQVGGTHA
jgi:predicted site-specific integrase-resolvase